MARARRWDGIIPQVLEDGEGRQPTLQEVEGLRGELDDDADIVIEGSTAEHSPVAYAAAGATWWIESMWEAVGEHSPVASTHDRLCEGPPAP
jgi:hypothetical protein